MIPQVTDSNLTWFQSLKFFCWKVLRRILCTKSAFSHRRLSSDFCPIFHTEDHRLFECSWVRLVWFGSSLNWPFLLGCSYICVGSSGTILFLKGTLWVLLLLFVWPKLRCRSMLDLPSTGFSKG